MIDPHFFKQTDPFPDSGDQADAHKFRGDYLTGVGVKSDDDGLAPIGSGFRFHFIQYFPVTHMHPVKCTDGDNGIPEGR